MDLAALSDRIIDRYGRYYGGKLPEYQGGRAYPNLAEWKRMYPDFEFRRIPDMMPKGQCRVCGRRLSTKRHGTCTDGRKVHGVKHCGWVYRETVYTTHWLKRQVAIYSGCRCEKCGRPDLITEHGGCFPGFQFELHHILPVEMGGGGHWENLTYLCKTCHLDVHRILRDTGEMWFPERLKEATDHVDA